jgi:mannose-6-phosphate isomerase-like protein (cupin superfamily)
MGRKNDFQNNWIYIKGTKMIASNEFEVNNCEIYSSEIGFLGVISISQVPFEVKRFFWLASIAENESRANHAHRTCEQYLLCMSGSIDVRVTSLKIQTKELVLCAGQGLLVPALNWLHLHNFTRGTVLGVFASEPYSKAEYIEDFDEFRSFANSGKNLK